MAPKKEETVTGEATPVDPFASVELSDPKDTPKRSSAGRPPSALCLKFREQLEGSLKDRKVRSIPLPLADKEDYAGQMHRAGKMNGYPEIKSSYSYDVIAGIFRFAPVEVWNEAKGGK